MITSLPAPRFRLALWAVFLASLGLMLVILRHVAHAGAVADPVATGQAAVDAGWSLVANYGPIWGGALLISGGFGALLKANESERWIAQGRRLAVITGISSVLVALLAWHFHGAPEAGVLVTAFTAIKLVVSPFVAPLAAAPGSSSSSAARSGTTFVALLGLAIAGTVIVSACGPKTTAILDAAIDCTRQARADLVAAIEPTAESAIDKIKDPSGKVTTDALRALFAKASVESEAGIILACAEKKAIDALSTFLPPPPVPVPGSVATSSLVRSPTIDAASLRAAFAQQFPGVSFKTSAGGPAASRSAAPAPLAELDVEPSREFCGSECTSDRECLGGTACNTCVAHLCTVFHEPAKPELVAVPTAMQMPAGG